MAGAPRLPRPHYGWLLAGLARQVTGLGMADLVRAELAEPLATEGLCIGRPPDGRPPPVRATHQLGPAHPSYPRVLWPGSATGRCLRSAN